MIWSKWTAMNSFLRSFQTFTSKQIYTVVSRKVRSNRSKNRLPILMLAGIVKVSDSVTKSKSDDRKYRGLELKNGMKVLLISDPETDRSAVSMDVHVGCMKDPRELPGLAHFCEHMLFMGTEKYPNEEEYEKFISEHGGSSNAYTDLEHTNYCFDIMPQHLPGALDRFAQFFISPLFSPSAIEREVNAVDSENTGNLMNDSWRLFQLTRSLADPNHDLNKFGSGNKETLLTIPKSKNINVRNELLKFHKQFYSANIMGCCVVGKEGLDTLQAMVVPLLEKVPNKHVTIPRWDDPPFTPSQLQDTVHIVPVQNMRYMYLTWVTPDVAPHYKENPVRYLDHLLGHEGAGSLLSELKARGWANYLSAGQTLELSGFALFSVEFDLTEEGEQHTDEMVQMVYQYLAMLKKDGPQEWVYNECRDLSAMIFHLKEKEDPLDYAISLATRITEIPVEDALSAYILLEKFRPDLINSILDKMVPSNMKLGIVSKKFTGMTNEKEKWYGTPYKTTKFEPKQVKNWKECGSNPNLRLPMRNTFIPQNFDIVKREKAQTNPDLIRNTKLSRLWYKQDSQFLKPKAVISLQFESPVVYRDPMNTYLNFLFTQLFNDAMTEVSYMASEAGVSYSFQNSPLGLSLDVGGFNDKLPVFLKTIIQKMTTLDIDPKKIAILNEMNKRQLNNFESDQPYQQAVLYTTMLTTDTMWTYPEISAIVDKVTGAKVQSYMNEVMSKLFVEAFVYGNVTKTQSQELMNIVEEGLKKEYKTKPLSESERPVFREVNMPDQSYFLKEMKNTVQPAYAVDMYLQCGPQDTRSNVLMELLAQVVEQPCFNILRNQEQLGYIVMSGVRRTKGVQGLRFLVQSPYPAEHVEKRIEAFLDHMDDYISNMNYRTFESHKEALATERLEKPRNMYDENGYWMAEINAGTYHFKRDEVEVKQLRNLTQDDLYNFYREHIAIDAPKRHKLVVHVLPEKSDRSDNAGKGDDEEENNKQGEREADYVDINLDILPSPDLPTPKIITDISDFKSALPLYPPAKPYIDFTKIKTGIDF